MEIQEYSRVPQADIQGQVVKSVSNILLIHGDEIRSIFYKQANQAGFIKIEKLTDLIQSISRYLPPKMNDASLLFLPENKTILEIYDTKALTYVDFLELLSYLIQQTSKPPEKSKSVNQTANIDVTEFPQRYQENQTNLKKLMMQHHQQLLNKYNEHKLSEDSGGISMENFYIFLQECCHIGSMVLLERAQDTESIFESKESYRKLEKLTKSFFKSERHDSGGRIEIKFEDCFQVLEHWFKTDREVVLQNENSSKKKVLTERENVLRMITKYEKAKSECTDEVEKSALQNTIDTLYKKLYSIDHRPNSILKQERVKPTQEGEEEWSLSPRKKRFIREEKKVRALKEIFDVYARRGAGSHFLYKNFDDIDRQSHEITLENFSIFLKDFRVKIDPAKLTELFKKHRRESEMLGFNEFYILLKTVANYAEFITENKAKPDFAVKVQYRPDSYKNMPIFKRDKSNLRNKGEKSALLRFDVKDRCENLWIHMGLEDDSYKKTIKAIKQGSPEVLTLRKNIVAPSNVLGKVKFRYRPMAGRTEDEVREEIERRKVAKSVLRRRSDLRTSLADDITELSLIRNRASSQVNLPRKGKRTPEPLDSINRSQKMKKNFTLKKIEKLHEKDLMNFDKKFHPRDLIDQNDSEDDVYLADYDINKPDPEEKFVDTKIDEKARFLHAVKLPAYLRKYSQIHEYKVNRRSVEKNGSSVFDDENPSKKVLPTEMVAQTDRGYQNDRNLSREHEAEQDQEQEQELEAEEFQQNPNNYDQDDPYFMEEGYDNQPDESPNSISVIDNHPYQPPIIQSDRPLIPRQYSISNAARERALELQDYLKRKEIQIINNMLNVQRVMRLKGDRAAWR